MIHAKGIKTRRRKGKWSKPSVVISDDKRFRCRVTPNEAANVASSILMATLDAGETDDAVNEGLRPLRADYWRTVRAIAKECLDEAKSNPVLSHGRTVVECALELAGEREHPGAPTTFDLLQTIMVSDNRDAWEETGCELSGSTWDVMTLIASEAFRSDLRAQVEAEASEP